MQTGPNPTDTSTNARSSLFSRLKVGDKLAGCYVLNGEKYSNEITAIWHAYDEVLGKDIALHFLPQSIRSDKKAMDDLRHLTKRNRQLIHPKILRIYDFVEEDGWAAISTEPIEGECVTHLRSKRPGGFFEIAEIKPWLSQIAQTLDDAHKIQLFHGDLSPEHLFVDKSGRLVVAGFGIGRCVRDATWRANGSDCGDPPVGNLSPQMLAGQASTAADDVYATGVLLHELLVGEPPFTDPNITFKIRDTPAQKVLERRSQLRKAGGPVPPIWEKAIAACLEKTREHRPKSLAELSTRLALPGVGSQSQETPLCDTPIESTTEGSKTEFEPAIPIIKKAWVGSTYSAPVVSGGRISKGRRQIEVVEANESNSTESQDERMDSVNTLADEYPGGRTRRSGFPITGIAAALLLGGLCVYAAISGGFRKDDQANSDATIRTVPAGATEYATVQNPILESTDETNAIGDDSDTPPEVEPDLETGQAEMRSAVDERPPFVASTDNPLPTSTRTFSPRPEIEPALTLVANTKPQKKPEASQATPIPATPVSPAGVSASSKTASLEATRKSVDEWEKTHATMLKKKEQAEAAIADAKKTLEEKMKAVAPMLKASEEVAAIKQQREEAMRVAELAAVEAKKMADEKARLAEEAKKALVNVEKDNRDKLVGQKQAEAELDEIKKVIAENERLVAESAKLAEGAMAKKVEQTALLQQKEQEAALAMAAAEAEAQRKRELEEKRSMIMKEMAEAKKAFEERMKALESSLKEPDASTIPPKPPINKAPTDTKPEAAAPGSTPPTVASISPTPVAPELPKPGATASPAPPAADATLLAKMEKPLTVPAVEPKEGALTSGNTAVNSLGIPFVPIGDVQFAVWPTRLKDFEAFATATGLKSSQWRDPGFKQGPDHPVVNVTWMEAMAFCKWLTFKEQRDGTLPPGRAYRLPTDLEWSRAVGLQEESGRTAEARDMGVPDVYPWGTTWPPPEGAGNYTGEETGSDVAIKGYSDGFPWTSPVGSFPANKYGLSDMGGNVWQWVMDPWNTDSNSKVLRGGSWYNGALKLSLLSSCRVHAAQDSSTDNYGFRCVIATDSPKSVKR